MTSKIMDIKAPEDIVNRVGLAVVRILGSRGRADIRFPLARELPKNSKQVFEATQDAMRKSFTPQRRRAANKLKNPRLLQISFHTFRHWKATMEYHKTRDILHVMQLLGHRNIQNTLIYTRLIGFKDDEYTAKVAASEKEVCQLVEAGFE